MLLIKIFQNVYDAGLLRKHVRGDQIRVVDSQEEWYNAYEKDIAVANFYYSKPTSIGKNFDHSLVAFFLYLGHFQNTEGLSTWALLTLSPNWEDFLDFAWDSV